MEVENIQNEIVSKLISKLHKQFENTFKEGLRLKGFEFEFESQIEFEKFVSENCKCEDYASEKRRVYFVKEIPFFIHYYEQVFEPIQQQNNSIYLSANNGTYQFI